jgi:enoyl-CoA hydratase/carnithine racemase
VDEAYDTGFIKRVEAVAAEAEEVALEIAGGKEITAREQQDLMWQSGTVSVWDLEQVSARRRSTRAHPSQNRVGVQK